jgi:hypothetical protein
MKRSRQLALAGGIALALCWSAGAQAQIYTNGPGFYMSLEGRYLQNEGNRSQLGTPPPQQNDDKNFTTTPRDDKNLGGKATMGYRFDNNWDFGVSGSGFKSQR